MPRLPLLFVLGAFIPVSGCTHRIWFTQPLREGFELAVDNHALDDPDVGEAGHGQPARAPDELQYFVSDRIVLRRELSTRHDAIDGGRVLVRHGRTIEQVIVRRGTPGVAVDWGPDWVAVSFAKGTHLVFELAGRGEDEPGGGLEPATYYRLRTSDNEGALGVELEGRTFVPVDNSANARLKIKRTAWMKQKRSRRVLRGRRLNASND